jgi:integrase
MKNGRTGSGGTRIAGLTQRRLETVKPGNDRLEMPDKLVPGLYFIIQPSGAKSWAVRSRIHGKSIKITLGSFTVLPLAKARELGREVILTAKAGRDPRAERKAARAKAEAATANSLRNVCELYLSREGKKLRTADQRTRLLERLVFPKLGGRQIDTITRGELITLLDAIEDENGVRTADMTLAVLRKIFNWHAVRDESFRTPVVRGMARGKPKEAARARILNDNELRRVWRTATQEPFPVFVRFLLLTAARRGEAAGMTWNELDGSDWVLPASRNKTKVDLVRPLSKAAHELVASQPRFQDFSFVFTTDGKRPLGGFSKFKTAFDKRCGVTDWTLHDLRRTARSLMSRAGCNADHAERCLGHVIAGVRGVYDRHEFHDEKRQAYEALATMIERIAAGETGANVLPMRKVTGLDQHA